MKVGEASGHRIIGYLGEGKVYVMEASGERGPLRQRNVKGNDVEGQSRQGCDCLKTDVDNAVWLTKENVS